MEVIIQFLLKKEKKKRDVDLMVNKQDNNITLNRWKPEVTQRSKYCILGKKLLIEFKT